MRLPVIHRRVLPCSNVYKRRALKVANSYLLSSDRLSDHRY